MGGGLCAALSGSKVVAVAVAVAVAVVVAVVVVVVDSYAKPSVLSGGDGGCVSPPPPSLALFRWLGTQHGIQGTGQKDFSSNL